jgi:hypothetical protein
MKLKYKLLLTLFSIFFYAHSQNNITFSNFLSYSSAWQFGGYSNANNSRWKDIYYVKGDTLVANNWYYKVYQQYQVFDQNAVLKSVKNNYSYLIRETKDSNLITLNLQGIFTISHKTSDLSSNYAYKLDFPKAQIPFITFYDEQKFGAACGFMQGIGTNPCPPSLQGVTYFECYQKNGKSTDKDGNPCSIKLITTAEKTSFFEKKIEIFPNPTFDEFLIKNEKYDDFEIEIFDLAGKLHKKESIMNNSKIIIADFQNGIYLLKISDKSENHFFKIIKY